MTHIVLPHTIQRENVMQELPNRHHHQQHYKCNENNNGTASSVEVSTPYSKRIDE